MGRKTQVTKETMLEAAYDILEKDGYDQVTIKAVAARVGCSTQPISWQFGNMQQMRRELFEYATDKIFGGYEEKTKGMNALESFFESGKTYIRNAIEHPHVFRFLCVDNPGALIDKRTNALEIIGCERIREMLSKEFDLPRETLEKMTADVIIYTHGLATMLLWEAFDMDLDTAIRMVYDNAAACFRQYGIDAEKYITL